MLAEVISSERSEHRKHQINAETMFESVRGRSLVLLKMCDAMGNPWYWNGKFRALQKNMSGTALKIVNEGS